MRQLSYADFGLEMGENKVNKVTALDVAEMMLGEIALGDKKKERRILIGYAGRCDAEN